MPERIVWVDFAKGSAIILVVLGHFSEGDLQKFIFVFHMPFFFVMAGYLLNFNKWGGVGNYKSFAKKLFKRLLLPYYLAELLWYPIWFVICHETEYLKYLWGWCEIDSFNAFLVIFISNGASNDLILGQLWFLPVLFFAEIIFVKLFNYLNKLGAEVFTLSVVIAVCVGFNLKNLLFLPLGIDIALTTQIFLLAGVLIRRYNFVEKISLKTCTVLTLILVFVSCLNSFVDMHSRRYGESLMFYAGGMAGTLLVMKLSALMAGGKTSSLISDCGRQSMMILILHPIIANVFYETVAATTNFPPEEFFTEPIIIFAATALGVLIPLFIAKRFGKLPVLKYFCA
ncbi:MAG: acyltransferase family protein [Selenomonadaceae bacterium]|nr:acyltransferase family protein [Selenomonadaceae bacterium]